MRSGVTADGFGMCSSDRVICEISDDEDSTMIIHQVDPSLDPEEPCEGDKDKAQHTTEQLLVRIFPDMTILATLLSKLQNAYPG